MTDSADSNNQATHIVAFFAHYPDFDYKPTAPVWSNFARLRRQQLQRGKWQKKSVEYRKARGGFADALGRQFAAFYGSDVKDIKAWKALCTALRVDPVPESAAQCKKIVKSTHVNLVDFIDIRLTGKPVKIFRTADELAEYTVKTGKIFPKRSAKQSGVLKYLLRRIF